ncbi:ABC transporter permease [Neomegalonema perideroedes]|uniref:ABC transporter permease n=1 Tax=Neomegalonema perideroedes TaxID=217219 RepID=UPI0003693534|nr:ABC transporter permease [Neomegalonema perideroedes]
MSQPAAKLPFWVDFGLIPLLNLVAAFAVAGLVVAVIGENPLDVARIIIYGAFGYGEGVGFTLFYATNFIFTGLAVAVAFHAGLFNIGGEGQAYIGGLGVALVALGLDPYLPWWLLAPLAVIGAALFGALWAYIPAVLQAKRGSHIVITTIMFNFIAASLMAYLLVDVLNPGAGSMSPGTRFFNAEAVPPRLSEILAPFGVDLGGSPANLSLIVALLAALGLWLLLWRTRLGYEIRALGHNASAAAYAGVPIARVIVIAMLISGALAGMMALNPVLGDQGRLLLEFPGGAGFVGIAVALMGRSHPLGVILAALLFGMLYQGGSELAFEKPSISRDMLILIQGLVILFSGALENLFRPAVARIFAPRAA